MKEMLHRPEDRIDFARNLLTYVHEVYCGEVQARTRDQRKPLRSWAQGTQASICHHLIPIYISHVAANAVKVGDVSTVVMI